MATWLGGMERGGLDGLRRRNAAAILQSVRTRGPLSRSEIAAHVGLSPTAVTKITYDLLRADFINELSQPASDAREPGRPRIPLTLNRSRHRFVGVHIGLQRVTVGLVDLTGEVVALRARAHGSARPDSVLAKARRIVQEVVKENGAGSILAYGACAGGWVSPDDGVVHEFPGLSWHEVRLRDGLRLDGLPEPFIDNTVRALALAEARLGAAQGADDMLYVFTGNIMGCAHVRHGQIARGRRSAAGVIDHLPSTGQRGITCTCGRHDCLWAVASDLAVVTAARENGIAGADAHIEDVIELARTNSPAAGQAERILARRARNVGRSVGALLDIYDPDVVVVGGGVRLAEGQFAELVAAAHLRGALPHDKTPVLPAALVGAASRVQGAVAPAMDAIYDDPLSALSLLSG